jgi:riboflavin transporter FmnP
MEKTQLLIIIFCRFSIAFLLGILPFAFGLKNDWYVIPLIIFGFIFQFGLATLQMIPYFNKFKNK